MANNSKTTDAYRWQPLKVVLLDRVVRFHVFRLSVLREFLELRTAARCDCFPGVGFFTCHSRVLLPGREGREA